VDPEHSTRGQLEDLDEMLGICWTMHANGPTTLFVCIRSAKIRALSFWLTMTDRALGQRCAMKSFSEECALMKWRLGPVSVCLLCAILSRCMRDHLS
jgi:hypothetical protein